MAGGRPRLTAAEIVDKRYGMLVVLSISGADRWGQTRVLCRCDCGKEKEVNAKQIRSGRTVSCGCHRHSGDSNRTHGMAESPEYSSWAQMINRCLNSNCDAWDDYGGRGITVCERWKSFENFYSDMGPRPSMRHSIDRFPDPNGNYEPGNCRWATMKEQCRNRRSNLLLTLNGITLCAAEWAERLGVKAATLQARKRYGWSDQETLTVSIRNH